MQFVCILNGGRTYILWCTSGRVRPTPTYLLNREKLRAVFHGIYLEWYISIASWFEEIYLLSFFRNRKTGTFTGVGRTFSHCRLLSTWYENDKYFANFFFLVIYIPNMLTTSTKPNLDKFEIYFHMNYDHELFILVNP